MKKRTTLCLIITACLLQTAINVSAQKWALGVNGGVNVFSQKPFGDIVLIGENAKPALKPFFGLHINRKISKRISIELATNIFRFRSSKDVILLYPPIATHSIESSDNLIQGNLMLKYNYIKRENSQLYCLAGVGVDFYLSNQKSFETATGEQVSTRRYYYRDFPARLLVGTGYAQKINRKLQFNAEAIFHADYTTLFHTLAPAISRFHYSVALQTGISYIF